jgi:hypothetical protein
MSQALHFILLRMWRAELAGSRGRFGASDAFFVFCSGPDSLQIKFQFFFAWSQGRLFLR